MLQAAQRPELHLGLPRFLFGGASTCGWSPVEHARRENVGGLLTCSDFSGLSTRWSRSFSEALSGARETQTQQVRAHARSDSRRCSGVASNLDGCRCNHVLKWSEMVRRIWRARQGTRQRHGIPTDGPKRLKTAYEFLCDPPTPDRASAGLALGIDRARDLT